MLTKHFIKQLSESYVSTAEEVKSLGMNSEG